MRRGILSYGLVFWVAMLAAPALAGDDAGRGRDIAVKHCSRCHVIGDFNRFGGIGSTPSFQLLATMSDFEERFLTFFERRPHPVFVRIPGVPRWTKLPPHVMPFDLLAGDAEDILAFVRTLEKPNLAAPPRRRAGGG